MSQRQRTDSTQVNATRRALLKSCAASVASLSACGKLVDPADYPTVDCDNGCLHVDVHCHVFNGSDLPIEGFLTHTRGIPERLASPLHRALNDQAPNAREERQRLHAQASAGLIHPPVSNGLSGKLAEIAEELTPTLKGPLGQEFAGAPEQLIRVLERVVRPRYLVAAELVGTYPTVQLFTPLLVDYDYFANDKPETPVTEQLLVHSEISVLSMQQRLVRPDARLHPFVGYNPLREVREVIDTLGEDYRPLGDWKLGDAYACNAPLKPLAPGSAPPSAAGALSLVRHAVEQLGFIGVKLYPPSGFLPLDNATRADGLKVMGGGLGGQLDRALSALYAYCEAEEVPITTHAANSNAYHMGFGVLAEPLGWAPVLKKFPNLRLNLGHFGHLEGIAEHHEPKAAFQACRAWLRQAGVLMAKYPNVYADVSNSPLPVEHGFGERYAALLKQLFKSYPQTKKRLMFGSDWWMNTLSPNSEIFVNAFHQEFGDSELADARDDFMGNNALRFLGFGPSAPQTNRNRLRLRKFYQKHGALPQSWLA